MVLALTLAVALAVALTLAIALTLTVALTLTLAVALALTLAVALALTLAVALALTLAVALALTLVIALALVIALTLAVALAKKSRQIPVLVSAGTTGLALALALSWLTFSTLTRQLNWCRSRYNQICLHYILWCLVCEWLYSAYLTTNDPTIINVQVKVYQPAAFACSLILVGIFENNIATGFTLDV